MSVDEENYVILEMTTIDLFKGTTIGLILQVVEKWYVVNNCNAWLDSG